MKNKKPTRAREFLENKFGSPNSTEEFDSLGSVIDEVLIGLITEIKSLEMRIVTLERRISPDSANGNKEVKGKKIGAIIVGSD